MSKKCMYCQPVDFPEQNEVLLTFDTDSDLEGYINIDKIKGEGMHLIVQVDYGSSATKVNYCPMCGRKLEGA